MAFLSALSPLKKGTLAIEQQHKLPLERTGCTREVVAKSHSRGLRAIRAVSTGKEPGWSVVAPNGIANKVALVALGCPKNTVDAEVMLGDLKKKGFQIVRQPRDADVVIVNTCTFVEEAKTESIEAVLEAVQLKSSSAKGVVVTGCMAQRYSGELAKEMPEVDAVIGFESYADISKSIERIISQSGFSMPEVSVGSTDVPFRPEWERVRLTQKHSAFIRVAEGCDHKCTFCAIPTWRGKFRSKSFDAIMNEVRMLVGEGVTEINLIAEDTNQWGTDFGQQDKRRLADLLHSLNEIPGIRRISLLYCYPSYFSDELIDAIASIDKVCKYVDMPLQHISDNVLKLMQRPPMAHTKVLLQKLRERIPGLVLRTTFITGFPGETEEDHQALVNFVKEMRFERAGVFAYSEEEGTPAASMRSAVPQEVRQKRRDELMSLIQDAQEKYSESLVGKVMEVVIDKAGEGGFGSVGRTRGDAPDIDCLVYFAQTLPAGSYVQARILDVHGFDLVADLEDPLEAERLSAIEAENIMKRATGAGLSPGRGGRGAHTHTHTHDSHAQHAHTHDTPTSPDTSSHAHSHSHDGEECHGHDSDAAAYTADAHTGAHAHEHDGEECLGHAESPPTHNSHTSHGHSHEH
jgi:ribosomal protein S12 methylthiotransferase